jgi:hypothetical protein
MTCAHCGALFDPKHHRGRFCGARCRVAHWHQERRDTLDGLEALLLRAVESIRTLRKAKRP